MPGSRWWRSGNPNLNSETAEDYRAMSRTIEALEYTTRAEDPVFWKLREMNENRLDSEIQIITENRAAEGIKGWLETNEDLEMQQRTLVGLNAMKENAMEDLTYAVNFQDHELYKKTLDQIDANTGEYAEILGKQSGEIWTDERSDEGRLGDPDLLRVSGRRRVLEPSEGHDDRRDRGDADRDQRRDVGADTHQLFQFALTSEIDLDESLKQNCQVMLLRFGTREKSVHIPLHPTLQGADVHPADRAVGGILGGEEVDHDVVPGITARGPVATPVQALGNLDSGNRIDAGIVATSHIVMIQLPDLWRPEGCIAVLEPALDALDEEVHPGRRGRRPFDDQLLPEHPVAVDPRLPLEHDPTGGSDDELADHPGKDERATDDDDANAHADDGVAGGSGTVGVSHGGHPQVSAPGEQRGGDGQADSGGKTGEISDQQETRVHGTSRRRLGHDCRGALLSPMITLGPSAQV